MRKAVCILLVFLCSSAFGVDNKTKLIVGITVNNFYPEWFSMYKNDLGEDGVKRLLRLGQLLTADYNYLFSQSGADQATIYTGTHPSEHGIVAHEWYERLKGRRQSNVIGEKYHILGEETEEKGLSPDGLQTLTLGCVIKKDNPFSKVYSIAMNGEEAVLSGGSYANMAFWYSEKTGKWVSSDYYSASLPGWMKSYNEKKESDYFIEKNWIPLSDEKFSSGRSKHGSDFFYDLRQAKRKYHTYRILKATPYANTMVVNLAEELIRSEKLGTDNDVDLLALNLSCLDYMNRDFDVNASEFKDVVVRMDEDIARLLSTLDLKVGRGNYTVFLTFSEAREFLPVEWAKMRISSGYFSIYKAVALLKSYLNLIYGEGEWIADYDACQIYMNRELIEKNKLSLKEVQDKVAGFMVEFEGIKQVCTAYSLANNSSESGINALFKNSFSQKRSGDVLYVLQSSWIPELKDREDYYARYSKRRKVPLYLYGYGVDIPLERECNMTDILPTLCKFAGIQVLYPIEGKTFMK